jgi:PAS domain S-box-containing protein
MKRAAPASRSLYQALFEASPDGLLLVDPVTLKILECNDSACQMLGYTRGEMTAFSIADIEVQQESEQVRANAERIIAEGQLEFNTQHRAKDGTTRPVHVWARAIELDGEMRFFGIVRDVSLQHEAEARTHRALERFHSLVETFTDIVFQLDATGEPVGENASWLQFTGQSLQAAVAGHWREAFHPEDRDTVDALWSRMLQQGTPVQELGRLRRRDGEWRDVVVRATPVRDSQGKIIEWVGTCTDITARRQAERQVRQLNQLLNLTAQLAKIGGWEYDITSQRLTWTHQVYDLHELDPAVQPTVDEAIGFYAPEARPVISAAVQAAVEHGTPFDVELPLVTARGRRLWVRALGSVDQSQGRTTRVFGTIQDITERRHLDERSRLESTALNAAANAIVITDRDGIIRSANTAFTRLTGYTEAEAVGRRPGDLLSSGTHDGEFFRQFWETIVAGNVWRGEITNRRKGGSHYIEEMVVTPVKDASGVITHFVAIKEDLTQRRELERQLRHAQKMEAVGQLAGGVAHDFNNLLTVILSYAAFARSALPLNDPIRKDILEIESTAKRAADLTRQLLTFGRRSVVSPKPLDLNAVVKGAYPLLRRSIGEDVELVTMLADELGTVMADPVQIEQVLLNMTVNARDAMPQGGIITIETANRTLDAAYASRHVLVPPGSYVALSISDTGTGLSQDAEEHLFEPFFTTKPTGKGTGLGLATCFGIVRQCSGWIIPYSEPGAGTTFKVLLPRVGESAEPKEPPVLTAGLSGGTETVLVVEDARNVRRMIVRTLQSNGYQVLEASTGDEALRLAEAYPERIDLLVTDIVMPGMRGSVLAARLRALRPPLKTLYMSGYTPDTQTDFSRLDTGSAFLPKPFVGDDLARTVRALLDRTASDMA